MLNNILKLYCLQNISTLIFIVHEKQNEKFINIRIVKILCFNLCAKKKQFKFQNIVRFGIRLDVLKSKLIILYAIYDFDRRQNFTRIGNFFSTRCNIVILLANQIL